jgi:predicted nuclease of predicted toxin-antitoxin system
MIVIDENVDQILIDRLVSKNYKIISIREYKPGISDREVTELAKLKNGLVITEDKDFGELVFSYDIKNCSVIFLRYDKKDYNQIEKNILKVLENYYKNPGHHFITVTKKKIRIRKI